MQKQIKLKLGWVIVIYILLDGLATGIGMGVPFFNILFGFPVGVYLTLRLRKQSQLDENLIRRVLKWSALSACVTLLLMLVIWSSMASMLFDPAADLANFGIPMILYEPRASFIGWLALMILISPFLQFLMSLFGTQLMLAVRPRGSCLEQ